jgi:hypothetical protein
MIVSSKQSMSRLKSGTGGARVQANPVGREYARSPANFQRFIWTVPPTAALGEGKRLPADALPRFFTSPRIQ